MRIKKTAMAIIMFSAIVTFVGVNFASAQVYTPLVNIPGLPPDTAVNLSMYLVGLYDFLLSVVGIVAVMMLVIGGMRYITAAGNQASVSEAKDIITNALAGLLLAILSWVIVAEINPDVLYIKKPGGAFVDTDSTDLGACGIFDPATPFPGLNCNCVGGVMPPPVIPILAAFHEDHCDYLCKTLDLCNLPDPKSCIANGTPPKITTDIHSEFMLPPYEGKCHCVDDEFVEPDLTATPPPTTCQEVCSNPAMAVDREYHGVKFALKIFDEDMNSVSMNNNIFTLKVTEDYYFDFSDTYDCNDRLVHLAMEFDGTTTFALDSPDNWCCMNMNPTCVPDDDWGECCNVGGCVILGLYPYAQRNSCYTESYFYDASTSEPNATYPIYKYSYNFVSKHNLWIGGSAKTLATATPPNACKDVEKFFQIEIIP